MTPRETPSIPRPWTRPATPNQRPNRSFGGLYRTAEEEVRGESVGGVPLNAAEDAVVAALRMGYRVADEQIERARRVASRLRGAADRAGTEGLGDAADGVERLFTKVLQSGLQWIEENAKDPQSPLKRLASAELNLVSSLLGLRTATLGRPDSAAAPREREPDKPAPDTDSVGRSFHTRDRLAESVRIQHAEGSQTRAVQVITCRVNVDAGFKDAVTFYHLTDSVEPMAATLERTDGGLVLRVSTNMAHRAGRWRAAVLDGQRMQLGLIEIDL